MGVALRDFLDSILKSIQVGTLTDAEFATIDFDESPEFTHDAFIVLRDILHVRGASFGQLKKLRDVFVDEGVEISDNEIILARSRVFLGSGL